MEESVILALAVAPGQVGHFGSGHSGIGHGLGVPRHVIVT